MEAPSNFATSNGLLNMLLMKAVFFRILLGVPESFSFLRTFGAASKAVTTPVALTLHPCEYPEAAQNHTSWIALLWQHHYPQS